MKISTLFDRFFSNEERLKLKFSRKAKMLIRDKFGKDTGFSGRVDKMKGYNMTCDPMIIDPAKVTPNEEMWLRDMRLVRIFAISINGDCDKRIPVMVGLNNYGKMSVIGIQNLAQPDNFNGMQVREAGGIISRMQNIVSALSSDPVKNRDHFSIVHSIQKALEPRQDIFSGAGNYSFSI